MMISFPLACALMTAVFVTSVLSGILGMAGGMILMGLLVWLLPVQQAMILHSIAQFFANGSRAFIHRRHIYRPVLPYYLAGLFGTFLFFAAVSFVPDKAVVYLLLGLGPFMAYLLPKNLKLDFTKPAQAFFCGLSVTGFQLTGGVAGPLLDMFFQTRKLTRHETIATKAFTQSISHVMKFVYFAFVVSHTGGLTSGLPLWLCIAVVPMALAGSASSKFILERMTDAHFYRATQTVLFIVGAVYLTQAIMIWLPQGG